MFKTRFISMLVLLCLTVSGAWAGTLWTGGTYTAMANENRGAITVNDDATLTINEGVTVTVNNGLTIAEGKTLTVTGPGTLVVNGAKGNNGDFDAPGGNGGVAISGNIIVQGGATVTATGGNGGNGDGDDQGSNGGNGGVAISGNIIVQGGAVVTATGGNGGNGGNADYVGGNGGNGGNAFAGTLTYKSGTVTANGGSGGSGGTGMDANGSSGSAGKAFANDVDFSQTTGYSVTNGTSTIGSVLDQTKVVISAPATVAVTGVTLLPTTATLTVGETETLTATVLPGDATDKSVTWSSSNEAVATVSNEGVVTAVAAGEATITVTATNGTDVTTDDQTATCTVTVAEPTYTVSLKEGTDDAAKWQGKAGTGEYQALPLEGVAAGTAVTVKYDGRKRVRSVKAVKKAAAAAPAHEYVDLGLPSGLLWATCNVGADTPEAYGDYFAWGETTTKDTYNWSTYQYCMGSNTTLTKYCNNSSYGNNGFTDNLTTLLPEDDAATANWGGNWRMPTQEEWQELLDNTTVTWTTQNGVNGRLFTAKNGSGNSLFLPAAGNRYEDGLDDAGDWGYYWSSSLGTNNPRSAWYITFGSDSSNMYGGNRRGGFPVRPVREN